MNGHPRGKNNRMVETPSAHQLFYAEHQACACGGKRPQCTWLGANFRQVETIAEPFGQTCEALGVIFDLSDSRQFICKVTNTASRVEEISGEIRRLLEAGFIVQSDAVRGVTDLRAHRQKVHGIACSRDFACKRRSKIAVRDATFLKLFLSLVNSYEPRIVSLQPPNSVVLIIDVNCFH